MKARYAILLVLVPLLLACVPCSLPRPEQGTPLPSPAPPLATEQRSPVPPSGPGNVHYVSPDGDDANAGSLEAPWATPG